MQFSIVMYAIFAPHSIAISEGAFLFGAAAWGVQLLVKRPMKGPDTPVDIALFGFFACCTVSSFLSYYPLGSLDGLRSPAFFLAFYFVIGRIRSLRAGRLLALAIVGSCLINVAYSAARLAVGRGIRIDRFNQQSPLLGYDLVVGDVILQADGQKINSQEDLSRVVDSSRGKVDLSYQRTEEIREVQVSRQAIKEGPGRGAERLGIASSPGRNFRIMGFYSHYETYAEVLQLIASLAIGMLIGTRLKRPRQAVLLSSAVVLLCWALLMTSTRSVIFALGVSVVVMSIASMNKRIIILAGLLVLILAPIAVFKVQRSRGISFVNKNEGSTFYRLEVWREALHLIKNNPVVGIGKGSEGEMKKELGLFDHGKLPPGHFHSTPIQIATWWGLPALACYIAFMTILIYEIWKVVRLSKTTGDFASWGIALGVMGAVVGFNVSSLVQFNFGDGEVVMTFWLLTGMAFAIRRLIKGTGARWDAIGAPADDLLAVPIPASPVRNRSDKNRLQPPGATSEPTGPAATVRPRSG
jgi:O-antigen ligase